MRSGTKKTCHAKWALATSPCQLSALLEAGTGGVRAGDRSAVMLGAPVRRRGYRGQSINDLTYLQQLYALNNGEVKGFYDALSAHPSGFSNPPNCTPATPQCSLSGGFSNDDASRIHACRRVPHPDGAARRSQQSRSGSLNSAIARTRPRHLFRVLLVVDPNESGALSGPAFMMARG